MQYRKFTKAHCLLSVVKSCFESEQATHKYATKETEASINQPKKS